MRHLPVCYPLPSAVCCLCAVQCFGCCDTCRMQMGTVNGTTSERQSILYMSPFQKTNTTLSEIFPYIAEQLTGR